jgi:hypothetical protein
MFFPGQPPTSASAPAAASQLFPCPIPTFFPFPNLLMNAQFMAHQNRQPPWLPPMPAFRHPPAAAQPQIGIFPNPAASNQQQQLLRLMLAMGQASSQVMPEMIQFQCLFFNFFQQQKIPKSTEIQRRKPAGRKFDFAAIASCVESAEEEEQQEKPARRQMADQLKTEEEEEQKMMAMAPGHHQSPPQMRSNSTLLSAAVAIARAAAASSAVGNVIGQQRAVGTAQPWSVMNNLGLGISNIGMENNRISCKSQTPKHIVTYKQNNQSLHLMNS